MLYAQVIINIKRRQTDQLYSYRVPRQLTNLQVGDRVVVPFGKRFVDGLVWRIDQVAPRQKAKDIATVLAEQYRFSDSQLTLMKQLRADYLATYAEAFNTVLPAVQKLDKNISYTVVKATDQMARATVFSEKELEEKFSKSTINKWLRAGVLQKETSFDFKLEHVLEEWLELNFNDLDEALARLKPRATRQARILKYIWGVKRAAYRDVIAATNSARRDIVKLAEAGFFSLTKSAKQFDSSAYQLAGQKQAQSALTDDQKRVIATFNQAATPRRCLLHGVTGSGKTRVYIELAKQAIQQGGQVLVLVPEIALTPQLIARFSRQLAAEIGVIHSYVKATDKLTIYQKLQAGEIDIIIGARSALFAPFRSLDLIVIDEAHETSYKSDSLPRYHAVGLALALAEACRVDIVLGSATPAAMTYQKVKEKQLIYLSLPAAVSAIDQAQIEIVDIRGLSGSRSLISPLLKEAIGQTLATHEQIILFHNRKGFAHYRQCHQCGYLALCENCEVPMTVYQQGQWLQCHYCGFRKSDHQRCPQCHAELTDFGQGIDQLAEHVKVLFPEARLRIIDSDVTRSNSRYLQILDDFKNHHVDILLGTQILAKGLDFPDVTLVAVLYADQLLNMTDYRAAERSFQLISQVAGRAGRHQKKGRVIIQTHAPTHPVLQDVVRRDYKGFIEEELAQRTLLNYPPFVMLFTLKISAESEQAARQQAEIIYLFYEKNYKKHQIDVTVFPAVAAYYRKIKNRYHYHVTMKAAHQALRIVKKTLYLGIVKNKYQLVNASCWVDIDFDGY